MADNEKLEQAQTPAQSEAPAKKKAEKKPEKKSRPGMFKRMAQWFKEMKAELKKVQWPSWKQTINNTLIVLAFCIVVGLCIFVFDKLADGVLDALLKLFKSTV